VDRRNLLKSVALMAASAGLFAGSGGGVSASTSIKRTLKEKAMRMPFISAKDDTLLFYKDWGSGKPIVFVSSWGLNSDMWQYQMTPMVNQGLRCVAYDRRGHGRSAQPAHGYDYDTLADDLASVIEQLDLRQVTLIGHSMACAEIVRYLSRRGGARVSRIVLVAPTTPFLLKTPDNPDDMTREIFDHTRAEWAKDYPSWLADNVRPFFVADTS
jgi:non-heme chloroperoxidase